jgi:hypothetical protein
MLACLIDERSTEELRRIELRDREAVKPRALLRRIVNAAHNQS